MKMKTILLASQICAGILSFNALAHSPVKIILDSDMISDFDDVGAVACLHALADAGECEILATLSCTRSNRSVAAIEILNAWYGRPDIPVGCAKDIGVSGSGAESNAKNCPLDRGGHAKYVRLAKEYPQWVKHLDSDDAPDANEVYRRVLAAQPDRSVVICSVGFLTNLRRLLETKPDAISPLDGRALVAKKVKLWVAMACQYPKGKEYNSRYDAESSAIALEKWPTPIAFSDFEYGKNVYTGRRIAEDPSATGPVKDVFLRSLAPRSQCTATSWDRLSGHPSWDETAVLYAVRGAGEVFGVERGTHRMTGTDGSNVWTGDPKSRDLRLVEKLPYAEVGKIIDELMCRKPKFSAQRGSKVRTFGPGVHYLTETAVLTAEDSGTVWKAAPGAKPVVSGARKVTGWRKAGNGLWCADVPWVTGRETGFRQLAVDGALRPRAKHPNKDYFHSLDFPRPEGATWFAWEYNLEKPRFRINPGEVDPAWDLAKGEVIFYHIWVDSHCPASSQAVENGTNWLNLACGVRRNPCKCPWRLENLKEIADEPGEWALDYDEKRVYYRPMPGEDPAKAEIAVPFLETLVRIDGAKDVRFEGITFADARYELARDNRNDCQASVSVRAAVVLTNAVNCVFERCAFTHLSGYALDFQAGTCDSKVSRCALTVLGAGGVRLNHDVPKFENTTTNLGYAAYEMPDPRVRVRGNEISDCEIGDYGRDFPSAVGVLLMNAEDTKVVHNHVHDGYYTGVSVGWNWGYLPSVARDNLIEYNHIHDIGKGLISDMGGIYLLGVAPGTKVRYNLIHDVDARFYGGWGIYPDEGSSGLLIENNVVYGTKFAPFHQHFGRNNVVRNNVFAGGKIDQLAASRWEPHTRFFFYNNVVWWREGKLHSGSWHDDKAYPFLRIPQSFRAESDLKLKKTTECDYNLYFNPEKALKDVRWGTQNCSWDDWRGTYLQDKHSVWADPLFVDAAHHDYRLKPDSPALKLGFRPFDLSTVGPRLPPID